MKITKKLMSVVIAAVMVIGALAVSVSAEGIEDTAVDLSSGKKESFVLNGGSSKDYKIKLSKAGTLTLNLTSQISTTKVYLYDSDGNTIDANDVSSTSGSLDGDYRTPVWLSWNKTMEKFVGKVQYELKKGTYYIRIERSYNSGNGKVTFTATYPSKDSEEISGSSGKISYLTLEMEVGDTIRLGTVTEPADADVTWSTSKSKVATVSASGKVTAKKEGSAIITAKSGSSVKKIKIIVV